MQSYCTHVSSFASWLLQFYLRHNLHSQYRTTPFDVRADAEPGNHLKDFLCVTPYLDLPTGKALYCGKIRDFITIVHGVVSKLGFLDTVRQ